MKKKILSTFLLLLVSFYFFVPKIASAQTSTWYRPTMQEFMQKVNGSGASDSEVFGERYTHAQVYWIVFSLASLLTDPTISSCVNTGGGATAIATCICGGTACPTSSIPSGLASSPILNVAALIDQMRTTRISSGVQWLSDTAARMNIIPVANAQQGFGFKTLQPALGLWSVTRNFSYSLLIIVIVILAFMIMFRVKTSPQTVVTIQSAIPKVAIALILITFSYAIAGLMVDLTFLIQGIIAAIFTTSNLGTNLTAAQVFSQINNPGNGMFALGVTIVLGMLLPAIGVGAAGGALVSLIGGPVTLFGGVGISIIFLLLVLVVVLIAYLRVFFVMLKTYVVVFLLVIAAPFYLLAGTVIPGFGVGSWIKNLMANLSVFVMVGLLVLFAHVFVFSFIGNGFLGQIIAQLNFANPYHIVVTPIGGVGILPSFTGMDPTLLGLLVGMVTLLSIPNLATVVKTAITGGRFAGLGMGESFGPVYNQARGYGLGEVQNAATKAELEYKAIAAPNTTQQGAYAARVAKYSLFSRILGGR